MLLRRFKDHVISENWFAVVLDLAVVVVGLFIGLQVDNWWGAQKDAQLESAYLLEIQEDFEANKSDLESKILDTEQVIRDMIVLHAQSSLEEPSLSSTELNKRFSSINRMPTFRLVSRAYANLTGSGDLKLIQNRRLKNALAAYYSQAQITALVQATHEMELVQTFQPYIIDNLDYAVVKHDRVDDFPLSASFDEGRILEVLGTRQFRNVIVQKWVISTDLLNQFRGMLKRTDEILQILE
jgi:hypothetical protein